MYESNIGSTAVSFKINCTLNTENRLCRTPSTQVYKVPNPHSATLMLALKLRRDYDALLCHDLARQYFQKFDSFIRPRLQPAVIFEHCPISTQFCGHKAELRHVLNVATLLRNS